MDSAFFLDIPNIKTNLESWRGNFSWPVPDSEWLYLNDYAFDRFDIALASLSRTDRDLLLTDFGFLNLYLGHLHLLRVIQCATTSGKKIIGSDPYLSVDWRGQGKIYEALPKRQMPQRLRYLTKNIILNRRFGLRCLTTWFSRASGQAMVLGSRSVLMAEYLKQHEELVSFRYPGEIVKACPPLKILASQAAQSIVWEIAKEAQAMWKLEVNFQDIADAWAKRLSFLAGLCDQITRSYSFPKTVYASNVAQPFIKLICLAARQQGTEAIGFSHGHNVAATIGRPFCYVEPPQFNRFVYPTEAAATNATENYSLSKIKNYYPVDFVSAQSTFYSQLIDRISAKPPPTIISTIMLMGFPLNAYHYLGNIACFSQFHLELGLRVIEFLKKRGYRVIYKGHPDRKSEALGVFDGIADEVLFDPFEKNWHKADAFLFTYPGTTTFGFALCCNRPIILLDHIDRQWNKTAFNLLAKRCRIVPCKQDERQRLIFSPEELEQALRPPEALDMDFVRRYLIGDIEGG